MSHPLFGRPGKGKTPPETVGFISTGTGGDHAFFASKGSEPSDKGKYFRSKDDAMRFLADNQPIDLGPISERSGTWRIIKRQF